MSSASLVRFLENISWQHLVLCQGILLRLFLHTWDFHCSNFQCVNCWRSATCWWWGWTTPGSRPSWTTSCRRSRSGSTLSPQSDSTWRSSKVGRAPCISALCIAPTVREGIGGSNQQSLAASLFRWLCNCFLKSQACSLWSNTDCKTKYQYESWLSWSSNAINWIIALQLHLLLSRVHLACPPPSRTPHPFRD